MLEEGISTLNLKPTLCGGLKKSQFSILINYAVCVSCWLHIESALWCDIILVYLLKSMDEKDSLVLMKMALCSLLLYLRLVENVAIIYLHVQVSHCMNYGLKTRYDEEAGPVCFLNALPSYLYPFVMLLTCGY